MYALLSAMKKVLKTNYKICMKGFVISGSAKLVGQEYSAFESCRMYSSKPKHDRKNSGTDLKQGDKALKNDKKNEVSTDSGYMKRRLEQLEEAAIEFGYNKEKMMGTISDRKKMETDKQSIVDQDPDLKGIFESLEQKNFESKYQRELSYTKIPSYASKESENIALSKPWEGGTNVEDVQKVLNNEMMSKHDRYVKSKNHISLPKSLGKSESVQDRLHRAREKSLDYTLAKYDKRKLNKDEEYEKKQSENFREMYKERLLGVPQVSIAAIDNSIKSLADSRIEEARAKGAFENLPRGKPIDGELNNNAYLDGTEYHLNKILKNQEITLPWIEKQGSVHVEISDFRKRLKKDWLTRAVHLIDGKLKEYGSGKLKEEKLDIIRYYAENYTQLHDKDWESRKTKELKPLIRKLNDSIRGYNLQAPMSSQIFYLLEDKEIIRAYKDASKEIYAETKKFLFGNKVESPRMRYHAVTNGNFGQSKKEKNSIFSMFNIFK